MIPTMFPILAVSRLVSDVGAISATLASTLGLCLLIWQIVKRTIINTVRPDIEASRALSKAQHDEQNKQMENLTGKVDGLSTLLADEAAKLSETTAAVARHAELLAAIRDGR